MRGQPSHAGAGTDESLPYRGRVARTEWDVAVVGGGPAGALAAREAALAGARTVLLERADLPRYKTCGGGLVGVARAALPVELDPLVRARVDRVTFSWQGRLAYTRTAEAPFLALVMRADLDAALVAAAAEAGAQIRTATTVTGFEQDCEQVTLTTRDGPVTATAVVGADGSSGRSAAHVGVRTAEVDLGLEAEIPVDRATAAAWQHRVLLDWGPVRGSYGWVFAKGELLSVGVIGPRDQGPALRDYYAALVARLGLSTAGALADSGHLTRCRLPGSPVHRGRVLVAGDAAGLLEPWTREGISYALRSGRLAGAAAARLAAGDPAAALLYRADIEAGLGPEMAAGRRLATAFGRAPGLFHALPRLDRGWGLFQRLTDGSSTVAAQVDRRGVRLALRALRV